MGSFTPLAYASYMLAKLTHAQDTPTWSGSTPSACSRSSFSFTGRRGGRVQGRGVPLGMLTEINSSTFQPRRGRGRLARPSSTATERSTCRRSALRAAQGAAAGRSRGGRGDQDVPQDGRLLRRTTTAGRSSTRSRFVDRHALEDRRQGARGGRPAAGAGDRGDHQPCRPGRATTNAPSASRACTPASTRRVVVERTGFEVTVPDDVPTTAEPTAEQLRLLREEIDPLGTVKFDFVAARSGWRTSRASSTLSGSGRRRPWPRREPTGTLRRPLIPSPHVRDRWPPGHHLPSNAASRFSSNARRPSETSWLAKMAGMRFSPSR